MSRKMEYPLSESLYSIKASNETNKQNTRAGGS